MWFLITILFGICFGVTTKIIIRNKGYDTKHWFWLGFWFGIFALTVACAKPPKWCLDCNCMKCNNKTEIYMNK